MFVFFLLMFNRSPWTGNCVGKRNYKYFLMYVLFVPLLCMFTIGACLAKIIVLSLNSPLTGPPAFWDAVTVDPAAPILVLYSFIPLGFVGMR
jgi:palmitoyltransferase ZDHHC9/14/18